MPENIRTRTDAGPGETRLATRGRPYVIGRAQRDTRTNLLRCGALIGRARNSNLVLPRQLRAFFGGYSWIQKRSS